MDTLQSTPDAIAQLTIKVTELERSAEIREGILSKALENNRLHEEYVDNFMDMLLTYVASDEIDSDVAEELAGCFGRDLTRKVTVNVDIRAELELVLPAGVDIESAMEEIDFGPNVHYATGIEIEYSDISIESVQEA